MTQLVSAPRIGHAHATAAYQLAAVGAGALTTSAVLSPAFVASGPVLCPFRLATGLDCPACGLTRSWVYTAHGHFGEAFTLHPFGALTMAAVAVFIAVVVVSLVRRTATPDPVSIARHPLTKIVAAAWVVFAAGRIATQALA